MVRLIRLFWQDFGCTEIELIKNTADDDSHEIAFFYKVKSYIGVNKYCVYSIFYIQLKV